MAGLSDFAKKPPIVQVGVFAAIGVVLGLVYWQFFYSSLEDELKSAKTRQAELMKKSKKLKKDQAEWKKLALEKERLDAKLEKNTVSLPASAELPAFFGHMQKQMAASGVTLRSWKKMKEKPVEGYVRVPVGIELRGTFYELNHYFHLLSETDRIITVENLKLGQPDVRAGELVLSAKFTAATFRQADVPPDTSLPDEEEVRANDAKAAVREAAERARQEAQTAGGATGTNAQPTSGQQGAGN